MLPGDSVYFLMRVPRSDEPVDQAEADSLNNSGKVLFTARYQERKIDINGMTFQMEDFLQLAAYIQTERIRFERFGPRHAGDPTLLGGRM